MSVQKDKLITAVAEGLASTDFFGDECVVYPQENRFYSLTVEMRAMHVKRAEIIVDRILESGVSLDVTSVS